MAEQQPGVRKSVFISYAHQDRRWVDELTTHLRPWVKSQRISTWDDRSIPAGTDWRAEIERALADAAVSVVIVTPSAVASDFIVDQELPRIIEGASRGTTRLVWIAAEPAAVEATPLVAYQAANDASRPLSTLSRPERQQVLNEIAKTIATSTTLGTLANSLTIVDETYEPLAAMIEGRAEQADPPFKVVAEYQPEQREITFTGGYRTIHYEELSTLPPEDHEFIQDLEETLRTNYRRWRDVRRGVGVAGGALDAEIDEQMRRIASLMCRDLTDILEFLRRIHKYDLEDHYGRYRFLCERLGSV